MQKTQTIARKSRRELQAEIEELSRRLEGAERPYRPLVETMDQAAAALASDGTILFCNDRLSSMLELPRDKLLGASFESHVAPAHRALFEARLAGAGGEGKPLELALVTGGDRAIPVLLSCRPLGPSARSGMGVIATDLSEQKRDAEMVASERLASSIIEQACEAIVICDSAGRIIRASRIATELCGSNPLLKRFEEAFPLEIAEPERLEGAPNPLDGGRLENLEATFARRDGRSFDLLLNVSPLRDSRDGIIGCVVTLTDYTGRKGAEREIVRLNEELRRHVLSLEAVNGELETFSHTVSHDLRSPLNNIKLCAEAILEVSGPLLDTRSLRLLADIGEQTARMDRLITALLDFSRLNRCEMVRADLDLSAMARSIAARLRLNQPGRRVGFSIAEGLVAKGDEQLLRVVMENLLGNSWKFTRRREDARIEVGRTSASGRTVFFVRDNGIGFDASQSAEIFKPFRRLRGSEEFEGNGIGLATVQRIILRHGGEIWAEGKVGEGAVIYFALAP